MIIPHSVLLTIKNVSDNGVDKIKTHIFYSKTFLNRSVYEMTCKNIVDPESLQMTIWRRRIACPVPKATDTHSEYVILCFFSIATTVTGKLLNIAV
jgi:hypothetical protein